MKIRAGFVSNSSSSSFTIATRSRLVFGYNGESLLEGVLKSILKVPEESPLYDIANRMAGCLVAKADEYTLHEMAEEGGFESVAQMLEDDPFLAKAVSKGMDRFYYGDVSDNDYHSVEAMLCNIALDYEDEDVMIEKSAGY